MPRYFFDLYDGEDSLDDIGTVLPDRKAVRGEAVRYAGEILRDLDGKLSGEEWGMTVRDENDQPVMTLRFSATDH